MSVRVLVVDDHEVTRKLLKEVLEKQGYSIQLAASGEEAVRWIHQEKFPVVVSDIKMIELDGMAVLREVKKTDAESAVILMTGFGSMQGAIQAIQEGAFDYVSKPFKMDDLKSIVARAVKHWESLQSARKAQGRETQPEKLEVSSRGIIGKSPKIVEVFKVLARAAMSTSTILVTGEKGTGKERVARTIHDNSGRRNQKFVAALCSTLNEVEFSRFFEEAQGGTLFLDEIGELSLQLQVKLLRVLQEEAFHYNSRDAGASAPVSHDVRIIGATDQDLDKLVKAGKFREDLYYRFKVILIELPPLCDRMEDLPELIQYFIAKYSEKNKKLVSHVSDEAMQLLTRYSWPGNVRELEHVIERAVAMSNTQVLFLEDFPAELSRSTGSDPNLELEKSESASHLSVKSWVGSWSRTLTGPSIGSPNGSLEEIEKAHILKVLDDVHYNKSRASDILGIDRATLYRKAQRYGIDLRGR